MCDDSIPLDIRRKDKWPSPDEGETIVVGAVGSAAPWFLTGWVEEVEIEFMIQDVRSRSWLHQCLNECVRQIRK